MSIIIVDFIKKGDRLLFFKKEDCLKSLAVHAEKVAYPPFFLKWNNNRDFCSIRIYDLILLVDFVFY